MVRHDARNASSAAPLANYSDARPKFPSIRDPVVRTDDPRNVFDGDHLTNQGSPQPDTKAKGLQKLRENVSILVVAESHVNRRCAPALKLHLYALSSRTPLQIGEIARKAQEIIGIGF